MAASHYQCPGFVILLHFFASFYHTDEETSTFRVPFPKKKYGAKYRWKTKVFPGIVKMDLPLMYGSCKTQIFSIMWDFAVLSSFYCFGVFGVSTDFGLQITWEWRVLASFYHMGAQTSSSGVPFSETKWAEIAPKRHFLGGTTKKS